MLLLHFAVSGQLNWSGTGHQVYRAVAIRYPRVTMGNVLLRFHIQFLQTEHWQDLYESLHQYAVGIQELLSM